MKYNILLLLCIIMMCSACLDDKTNLEYTELLLPDSVLVTNVATGTRVKYSDKTTNGNYSIIPGEELQLDPEVFYRGDDEITFEWYFGKELISKEKKLRHVFTESGTGLLMVYRKNAGNAVCYQISIKIRNIYATGVVVLGKNQGVVTLDYVERYYASTTVDYLGKESKITLYDFPYHEDAYALNNGGARLDVQNPMKLFRYRGFNSKTQFIGLQILGQDWQNSVTVNGSTMNKLVTMRDEFVSVPANFQPVNFCDVGAMSFILDKSGKIYTRVNYDEGNPGTGKYTSIPLGFNDPYDIPDRGTVDIKADRISPILGPSWDAGVMIYEKEKKRFLVISSTERVNQDAENFSIFSLGRPSNLNSLPAGYVNLDNFDKELVATIEGESKDDYYFIFKDGGDYYIQNISLGINSYVVPHQLMFSAKSCTKLPTEVVNLLKVGDNYFSVSLDARFQDVISFSSNNAIYRMYPSGIGLQKIFEFKQQDKITKFYTMMPWNESDKSEIERYYNGRVLCATFDNGDFKVVKIYYDHESGEEKYSYWVDKHYDGGVFDILYYAK